MHKTVGESGIGERRASLRESHIVSSCSTTGLRACARARFRGALRLRGRWSERKGDRESGSITTASETTASIEPTEVAQAAVPLEVAAESEPVVAHSIRWGEIDDKVADGARLMCVDTRAEFKIEHVKGASSVPVAKLDETSEGWEKDDTLILTSSAPEVSISAASHLARNGFTQVYYLDDGYEGWNGSFEGSDARESTVPSRLYYIYTTDENVRVLAGDMTGEQIVEASEELATSMQGLSKEFDGDIDVEILDFEESPGRIAELVDTYDVRTTLVDGIEYVITPCWIMVDRDGRVRHQNGYGLGSTVSSIYGWCVDQAEWE